MIPTCCAAETLSLKGEFVIVSVFEWEKEELVTSSRSCCASLLMPLHVMRPVADPEEERLLHVSSHTHTAHLQGPGGSNPPIRKTARLYCCGFSN